MIIKKRPLTFLNTAINKKNNYICADYKFTKFPPNRFLREM